MSRNSLKMSRPKVKIQNRKISAFLTNMRKYAYLNNYLLFNFAIFVYIVNCKDRFSNFRHASKEKSLLYGKIMMKIKR